MKVLHLINDLTTAGAQTVVMNYLRYFKNDEDLKMAVAIKGSPRQTEYEQEAKEKGFEIVFCNYKTFRAIPVIRPIINWFKGQYIIYKVLKEIRPDVVHTHGTKLLHFVLIPTLLAGIKKKFHTMHSDPYAVPNRYAFNAIIAFRFGGFYPICVTESQAEKAVKRYHITNYSVIKNGIDESRFNKLRNESGLKHQIGISDSSFVIGCVGRLDKIKNHIFLFDVFHEYLNKKRDSVLILLGDGSERKNLERYAEHLGIKNKVLFLGTQKDIEKYYYIMDVFCLTSFFESSSIVTVEAQFAGVRCVVSNNIPENVVVTDMVNRLSLKEPLEKWVSAINGELKSDKPMGSLEDFSLRNSAMRLKQLYMLDV